MSKVGQIERATQNRIVQLFQKQLQYRYLVIWKKKMNFEKYTMSLLIGKTHLL